MGSNHDLVAETAPQHHLPGQVVLVFQGGGALGSYQAGVYQALHEASIEPDWVIGTSIGAINAGLIAGNRRGDRWPGSRNSGSGSNRTRGISAGLASGISDALSNWSTMLGGIPSFFEPNPLAHLGMHLPLGADRAGVLFDHTARKDADRAGGFRPASTGQARG